MKYQCFTCPGECIIEIKNLAKGLPGPCVCPWHKFYNTANWQPIEEEKSLKNDIEDGSGVTL